MGNIYFTSDLHIGHNREFLYESRGFQSIEEHDRVLEENWNALVTDEDEVYVLGDMMLYDMDYGMAILGRLHGRVHIIRGNHDSDQKCERYLESPNVVEVVSALDLKAEGYHFFLSHYPAFTTHDADRKMKTAVLNLFGHTHQSENFFRIDGEFYPYMYHVGLNSHNMTPVLLQDVIEDIKSQKVHYSNHRKDMNGGVVEE